MRITRWALASAFTLVVACGGSSASPAPDTAAIESDIATYRHLATQTQAAASDYLQAWTSEPDMAFAGCQALHDQYDAHVRPLIARMVQMSGEMDDFLDAHGGEPSADMQCVGAGMMNDLDRHRTVACSFSDALAAQAEAARHVGAITTYAEHDVVRCNQMMDYLGGGPASWGSMMAGCEGWGGSSMGDGGMMSAH